MTLNVSIESCLLGYSQGKKTREKPLHFSQEIQNDIKKYAEEKELIDVLKVANIAINKCADAGWIHKDIEWRHIALMPVFDENSKIINLLPILIDYEKSEAEIDREKALETMKTRLDNIAADCIFKG